MASISHSTRGRWVSLLFAVLGPAAAQQVDDQAKATSAVQTLEEVRALPPEQEEVLDLYTFTNPVRVAPNTFNKSWSPPPSPKEISENGGYLLYGLAKLMEFATKDIKGIPGVRGQIQPAVARPPPLNPEQTDRAARIVAGDMSDNADTTQRVSSP